MSSWTFNRKLKCDLVKIEGRIVPQQNFSCCHALDEKRGDFFIMGGAQLLPKDCALSSAMISPFCYTMSLKSHRWKRLASMDVAYGGASCIFDQINSRIYVIGGAGESMNIRNMDILVYNLDSDCWSKLVPIQSNFLRRGLHIIKPAICLHNNKIYVFCCTTGNVGDFHHNVLTREPLLIFDLRTRKWEYSEQRGKVFLPKNCEKIGFVKLGKFLYCYGGRVKSIMYINMKSEQNKDKFFRGDGVLRRFDLDFLRWEIVKYTGVPPSNYLAVHMFGLGNSLLVFGGMIYNCSNGIDNYILNVKNKTKLYIFDTIKRNWKHYEISSPMYNRIGDSCCLFENYLYSFGGFSFGERGVWDDSKIINEYSVFRVNLEILPFFQRLRDEKERVLYILDLDKWRDLKILVRAIDPQKIFTKCKEKYHTFLVYKSILV